MKGIYVVSALAGCLGIMLGGCAKSAQAQGSGQRPAPVVSVVKMVPEEVTLTRELPGRTVPYLVAEVRPRVNGIVEERLFEEGSHVEAGQPLYQLDDALYRAEYERAKAAVEASRTAVELKRINAERTTQLYQSNAVSQQEFDNATSGLRQAEAELAVAEATLASAKVTLDYSLIASPITGQIGKSSVTKGALVTANQSDPLATVQELDTIYVDLNRSSRELLQYRKALSEGIYADAELPVTILLEDGTPYEHKGKVAFTDVTVDPTTGSFTLRVEVPNPDQLLLPGMYVRAVIGEGVREQAILVPQKAVQRDPSGRTSVMVVRDNNTVEHRSIVTGQSVGNKWLVTGGLLPGDRVVVDGLQKIRPEMTVQVGTAGAGTAEESPE